MGAIYPSFFEIFVDQGIQIKQFDPYDIID